MEKKYIKINGLDGGLMTYIIEEKINNEVFRKNIVIDLRYLDMSAVCYVLKNYKGIQSDIADIFNWYANDNKNDRLLYLYNDKIKDIVLKYETSITRDLHFYRKDFIDEVKFENIEENSVVLNSGNNIMVGNINVNTDGFNLIWGLNGSGKTVLLRQMADHFEVPIFNYYSKDIIKLDNDQVFMDYYNMLTGKKEITNYTGIDDVYYGICNGLTYGKLTGNIVLFDDLGWGLISDYNKIKIIDILSDYSYKNGIVMTSCQYDVKKLVKTRVYNQNVIDL